MTKVFCINSLKSRYFAITIAANLFCESTLFLVKGKQLAVFLLKDQKSEVQ